MEGYRKLVVAQKLNILCILRGMLSCGGMLVKNIFGTGRVVVTQGIKHGVYQYLDKSVSDLKENFIVHKWFS